LCAVWYFVPAEIGSEKSDRLEVEFAGHVSILTSNVCRTDLYSGLEASFGGGPNQQCLVLINGAQVKFFRIDIKVAHVMAGYSKDELHISR
jgi:hypothetical protein